MSDSLYGRSVDVLAQLTGAHRTTVRRWKHRKQATPWLQRLVRICLDGELADIHDTWDGWRIVEGTLISPEGWQFTQGEIRSIPFLHAQVKSYQQKLRYDVQADWVDQRYVAPEPLSVGPKAA